MNRLLTCFSGFLFCIFSLSAQGQAQQNTSSAAPTSTIRSTAQAVVLDMAFRDKKGRAIRDIRAEEIHISEDGVEQKLTSYRLVEGNMLSGNVFRLILPNCPNGGGFGSSRCLCFRI